MHAGFFSVKTFFYFFYFYNNKKIKLKKVRMTMANSIYPWVVVLSVYVKLAPGHGCTPGGVVMKIHGKIVTHYLSCTSPVDKEGYLYKKVRT